MVDLWLSGFRLSPTLKRLLLPVLFATTALGIGLSHAPESASFVGTDHSSARPLPSPTASSAPPLASTFDTLRTVSHHVFRHTNKTRRKRGLSTLQKENALAAVACAHNADMFRRDFFAHKNPDGERPQDRAMQMHRRLVGGVSENLYGQDRIQRGPNALAKLMVKKWLNSPPHRENLLDPLATHLGVCVLRQQNSIRATQIFAKIVAYLAAPFPRTVERGAVLPISFERTFPAGTSIAQYDFWDPRTESRVTAPTVFADTLHIPDTTGTLRPRFYVLEGGEYVIHQGPEVTVQSP